MKALDRAAAYGNKGQPPVKLDFGGLHYVHVLLFSMLNS